MSIHVHGRSIYVYTIIENQANGGREARGGIRGDVAVRSVYNECVALRIGGRVGVCQVQAA